MKHLIEDFCKGMYDSLDEQQKMRVSYAQLEDVLSKLIPIVLMKLVMVSIALIVSIPFIIKFHISNGVGMWILELCLWLVWIKESTDWKEFQDLIKILRR